MSGLKAGRISALMSVFWAVLAAPGAGGETAQFLRIGVGARAAGMGGAYTAVGDDVNAMAWNPAGLSLLSKREVGAMYADLVADTRYSFLGYGHPTKHGTFGAGLMYLGQGSLEGRDSQGRVNGGFTAADTAVSVSWAGKLGERLGLGGSVKFVRTSISGDAGQTVAFDLGGRYGLGRLGPGAASLGLAARNLGPGITMLSQSSQLPLTLAAGLGYRLALGLTVGLDVRNRPYAGNSEVSLGTEYAVVSRFAVRLGYASSHGLLSATTKTSDLMGLAAGFGVEALGMSLDYSMTPFGGLGNSLRFSLGGRF